MPLRENAPVGAPCWADIFTTDPDKTRAFYGELFGWESEEPNPDLGGYFNFTKEGQLVAGGMRNNGSSGAPDLWTVYLAVENAEATVAVAPEHGGSVEFPAVQVADLGSTSVLGDPGGARVGIWQPGLRKGFGMLNEPGAPAWFELHTREYNAPIAFYRDVFGGKRQLMLVHFMFDPSWDDGCSSCTAAADEVADGFLAHRGSYYFLDETVLGRQEDWGEPKGRVESAHSAMPDFSVDGEAKK